VTDALALTDIDAYYGDSHVLHRVGFLLRERRLLALLGRNGAGKTTCLASIMGFIRPRRGTISLFGEAIAGLAPEAIARRGIGLVPQGRRVFPSLTVAENLLVARQSTRGKAWTQRRIYDLFPRLFERRHTHAGSLSGGEQQMLAIGRALMGNPRVLLLDEPSEGLAPQMVAEITSIIGALKNEGMAMILVEQNITIAMALADDVAIVNTGVIVLSGSAADIAADEAAITHHLGIF
jgi:branched-chain amino acid transport system ATP-binding protein